MKEKNSGGTCVCVCVRVCDSYEAAVAVCKAIVNDYLAEAYQAGMSADELYKNYVAFGEDPWVSPIPEGEERFSAWNYAEARSKEICKAS